MAIQKEDSIDTSSLEAPLQHRYVLMCRINYGDRMAGVGGGREDHKNVWN
jgi:hypothetical protein